VRDTVLLNSYTHRSTRTYSYATYEYLASMFSRDMHIHVLLTLDALEKLFFNKRIDGLMSTTNVVRAPF